LFPSPFIFEVITFLYETRLGIVLQQVLRATVLWHTFVARNMSVQLSFLFSACLYLQYSISGHTVTSRNPSRQVFGKYFTLGEKYGVGGL